MVLIFVWRNALEYDQYNHVIGKLIIIIINITSKQYIYKSLPMLSSLTGPAYNKMTSFHSINRSLLYLIRSIKNHRINNLKIVTIIIIIIIGSSVHLISNEISR